ncbi:CBS domain-containing protein [Pendulispora rubella]|uniref:CBS domain-containing protein n=1 Tax=Pendulispora rubella TaxID=2741070 RepID=A0ABZ2KSI3_9BACT
MIQLTRTARTVAEIMNRDLVSVSEGATSETIRTTMLLSGITAVPVLDRDSRPVGIFSFRDVTTRAARIPRARAVATVPADTTIEEASRQLARIERHHLVIVDDDGRAIGTLSAIELLREWLGIPSARRR